MTAAVQTESFVHLVTTCRENEIIWLVEKTDSLYKEANENGMRFYVLLSEAEKWGQDSLDIANRAGIEVIEYEEESSEDRRPRIDKALELAHSIDEADVIILANADLGFGPGLVKDMLRTVRCQDFEAGYWHRVEREEGVEKGFYMHGVDVVALRANIAQRVTLSQRFRFGKVGWDYAIPMLLQSVCKQRFFKDRRLTHNMHASRHKIEEWYSCVEELVRISEK